MRKFFTLILLGVVACGSKQAKDKFLDLMDNVEFIDPIAVTIFTDDWTSVMDTDGLEYKFCKTYNLEFGSLVGEYRNEDEEISIFLGFIDDPFGNNGGIYLYSSGMVYDNLTDEEIYEVVFRHEPHDGYIDSGFTTINKWKVKPRIKNNGWNLESFDILGEEYRNYYYKTYYGDKECSVYIDKNRQCFIIRDYRYFLSIDLDNNHIYYNAFEYMGFDDEEAIYVIESLEGYLTTMYSQEGNSPQIKKIRKIIMQAKRMIYEQQNKE